MLFRQYWVLIETRHHKCIEIVLKPVNGKAHAETACLHVWHLVVGHSWTALLLRSYSRFWQTEKMPGDQILYLLWLLVLVLLLQLHKLQLVLKLLLFKSLLLLLLLLKLLQVVTFHFLNVLFQK